MNSESIKLVAQILSAIVSITALIISFRTERRNQKRFERQLELTNKIASANVKPLLAVSFEGYIDIKGMALDNHGPGTAVVTNLQFHRGKRGSKDLSELIDFDEEVIWNECPSYSDEPVYIPGKSSEVLLRLTLDRLTEDGMSEKRALELLESLEAQMDEISIVVSYEDVLGNKIDDGKRLRGPG
jgi:hypothetical protein